MRLLVLGGGGFLGYHVLAEALAAGHEVTAFSREGEAPLDGVEAIQGDRQGDLSALEGREWDAVLDTFGDPDAVARTAELLSGRVGALGFVSGISNYHPDGPATVDEGSALRRDEAQLEDDPLQERSLAKIAGEAAVRERFDGPAVIVRPGIMVGPRDPSDRFTWWPLRLRRALEEGGDSLEVLAPGDPDRPVQFTDARDLAAWTVRMLTARREGIFNAVGPLRSVSLREVLGACARAAGGDAESVRFEWAGEEFLRSELAEQPEEERPLWFPEEQIPFDAVDSSRAGAAGLVFRSAEETATDTLEWALGDAREDGLSAGFSPERERTLIARWRARGDG